MRRKERETEQRAWEINSECTVHEAEAARLGCEMCGANVYSAIRVTATTRAPAIDRYAYDIRQNPAPGFSALCTL